MTLRHRLATLRHRLAHWFRYQPCELLDVTDHGRVLVLRCTTCRTISRLELRGERRERRARRC